MPIHADPILRRPKNQRYSKACVPGGNPLITHAKAPEALLKVLAQHFGHHIAFGHGIGKIGDAKMFSLAARQLAKELLNILATAEVWYWREGRLLHPAKEHLTRFGRFRYGDRAFQYEMRILEMF